MYDDPVEPFFYKDNSPMPIPTIHTLPAVTIHITQKELEELLINTATHKSQGYTFVCMKPEKDGYKLTFVKIESLNQL